MNADVVPQLSYLMSPIPADGQPMPDVVDGQEGNQPSLLVPTLTQTATQPRQLALQIKSPAV
jgi:hypothetical protein